MKFDIKRITLKNLDEFYEFFKKTVAKEFWEYSKGDLGYIFTKGWSKKTYRDLLKNKDSFIIAALDNGKIVGILNADKPRLGVCFCSWLVVDKKYQGKGIGTKLIKEFEKKAYKKNLHMVYLYASIHNVSYYKKVGYKLVGNLKKAWFGQDYYIFTKLLCAPKEKNYLRKIKL